MNRFILVVLVVLSFQARLLAQKSNDSLIIGSWQLVDYDKDYEKNMGKNHEGMLDPNYTVTITFYKNHVYQKTSTYVRDSLRYGANYLKDTLATGNRRDTIGKPSNTYIYNAKSYTSTEGGKWDVDKYGYIFLKQRHGIQVHPYTMEDDMQKIYLLKDSLLILSSCGGRFKSYSDYKKIGLIPIQKDNFVRKVKHDLYLVNSRDTNISILLNNWNSMDIMTLDKKPAPDHDSVMATINTNIDSMANDNIYGRTYSETYTFYHRTGHFETKYSYYDLMDSTIYRKISSSSISQIHYTSSSQTDFAVFGSVMLGLGSVTAFIVAPLISINFKTGDFNSKRYFTVAGSGLLSIGIGIPLIAFNQGKDYKITPRYKRRDQKYWYFERK